MGLSKKYHEYIMLKLHQIYLKKFTILFILLFVVVWAIIYYSFKNIYIDEIKNSLLNNIKIISLQINKKSDIDALATQIKKTLGFRITIIDDSGIVIAESDKNKIEMENHKNRGEILQANRAEFGYNIRHSYTLNKDLLYVAKKFHIDENTLYIRMAQSIDKINAKLYAVAIKTGIALIVFFLLAFYVAYKVSLKLENEIGRIVKFLLNLTKKRKDSYIESKFSTEFFQITQLLTKVSQILIKQDKKKAKYTTKLKTISAQKDDIISAISHEFKNPIAVINGYSETLLNDNTLNSTIRTKFLTKIYNNGNKLSLLIDKLRLSIKLDEKKLSPDFVNLNLYNLVEQNIEDIEQNFQGRRVILRGLKDVTIKADQTLMEVAISNLIENALKYSEDDVHVNIEENSIGIIDQGIGIQKKELDNITKKFYRVSNNNWNNSLGLGLSIVLNITKLHHFKLKIESETNIGSTFTIIFK